jgi:hypothetical protein
VPVFYLLYVVFNFCCFCLFYFRIKNMAIVLCGACQIVRVNMNFPFDNFYASHNGRMPNPTNYP